MDGDVRGNDPMTTIGMRDSLQDVRRYWRGTGPLWPLFWTYGVVASTVGGTAILASVRYGATPWVTLGLVAAGLAYTAWVLVGVWRCAFNMSPQPFGFERETLGWMARLLTIGWAINAVGVSLLVLQAVFLMP